MALALVLISSHILNADIFPAIARDLPAAREVSTYGGAAFSAFLAFAAYRKPSLLNERFWSIACLTGTVIAAASLYEGLIEHSSFMLALGSPFGGIGGAWVSVLVGVSLAHCGPRKAAIVVPAVCRQYGNGGRRNPLHRNIDCRICHFFSGGMFPHSLRRKRHHSRSTRRRRARSAQCDKPRLVFPLLTPRIRIDPAVQYSLRVFARKHRHEFVSLNNDRILHADRHRFGRNPSAKSPFARRLLSCSGSLHHRGITYRTIHRARLARCNWKQGMQHFAFSGIGPVRHVGLLHRSGSREQK